MVAILREADRDPVSEVAKRHGVSEQAIYTWRKRFGGFPEPFEAQAFVAELAVEAVRIRASAI
jgi:transposase-like protein